MERSSEQFTVDRAPTVETLVDEKNPTVRAYTENLRHQIATIAARYGVNARDVFRADVQERMEIDDLATVAALVKRISVFSEKKVDEKEVVAFEHELDRRERRAREMLSNENIRLAVEKVWRAKGDIVRMYLRAGMIAEAVAFAEHGANDVPGEVRVEAMIAGALADPNPLACSDELRRAMRLASRVEGIATFERMRLYARALDLLLERSSDGYLLVLNDLADVESDSVRLYLIDRLAMEYERRSLANPSLHKNTRLMAVDDLLSLDAKVMYSDYELFLTEAQTRGGKDPDALLRRFLDVVRASPPSIDTFNNLVIIATRIGAAKTVDALMDPAFWTRGTPVPEFRRPFRPFITASAGWLEAGDLERAVACLDEDLRLHGKDGESVFIDRKIAYAFLDEDNIPRAESVIDAHSRPEDLLPIQSSREYFAARARRGDDILGEVMTLDGPEHPEFCASSQINAAIATIGFVNGMRRRNGERE